MTDTHYQVVIYGQLRPGFDQASVKQVLQQKLRLTGMQVDQLFSNPQTVMKRNIDLDTAQRHQKNLYKHGLISEVLNRDGIITPPPAEMQPQEGDPEYPQALAFEFTGNGKEYFKIWIVNIALTVLTLGIYSAWAKVRNKQYFYGNTFLQGASFEYTAQPLQILKGRMLAFLLIALYYSLTSFAPLEYQVYIYGVFIPLIILALPWVVMSSLKFNARHSNYRNISFGFDGTYWGAMKAFILWPILSFTMILVPCIWQRQHRYFVANSRYGTEKFKFDATVGDYFSIYGQLFLISFVAGIVFIPLVVVAGNLGQWFDPSVAAVGVVIIYALGYLVFGLGTRAFYAVKVNNLLYNSSSLGEHHLSSEYDLVSYIKLLFTNSMGILFTLGLFTPFAMIRSAHYHAEKSSFIANSSLDGFVAHQEQKANSIAEGLADGDDLFNMDLGITV